MTFSIHLHPAGQPIPRDACELLVSVFVGEGFSPAEQVAAGTFAPDVLATRGTAFIAKEASGRALGTLFILEHGNRFCRIAVAGESELHLMAVDPAQRGRGIGDALLGRCVDEAKRQGVRGLVLSTQPSMLAAHSLYKKHAFVRNQARDWQRPDGRMFLAYERAL